MNVRLLPIVRRYLAEFRHGRWKAGRIHVYSTPRQIVRDCRRALKTESLRRQHRLPRAALYLGAIAGVRSSLRLARQFRL